MKSHLQRFLTQFLAVLLFFISSCASAEETPGFPSIILDDFAHVATAPARWESQQWQNLGWATLAVAGTAVVADSAVRDFMCRQSKMPTCPNTSGSSNNDNAFLINVERFGTTYALGTISGFYLVGVVTDNAHTTQVAQDSISASLISATINQTIKVATSRSRPRENQGIADFQGYTGLSNNSSFSSGHTTEAFTLASVIASHYAENVWVPYAAYSVAGLVGFARMYHDAHFASDVTASAIIGTYVGRTVVQHNQSLRGNKVVLLPMLAPDYSGIQLLANF